MKRFKNIPLVIDKQKLLPALTLVVLVLLIVIQVDYIQRAAQLEQQNFSHRAMMALKDTRDEMARRAPTCNNMQNYLCGLDCADNGKQKAAAEVDSILRSNLQLYKIDIAYTFQISDTLSSTKEQSALDPTCYLQNLNGILQKNGIQMRLEFPDRNQFVMKQMSGLFALSILFIGFVMYSYVLSQRMSSRVQKQMLQTREFVNNMVHEFQTPLANMRFATNLMRKRVEAQCENPKVVGYADIILSENRKMEGHVQDILKVACSKQHVEESEIHLHEIVKKVSSDINFALEQNNGSLAIDLNANNDLVKADGSELERVISNLLDNALKYSNGKPDIYVYTSNENDTLLLKVRDKGIGIDSNELSKIFDQYYRVSTGDVHDVKGFGLGLTYVKRIVEKYGGRVSVKSKPQEETTFSVQMPLCAG